MALPLEKKFTEDPRKARQLLRTTVARARRRSSGDDDLVNALIDACTDAPPFAEAESAHPKEADALVAELKADPEAARAYLQSLGIFDEQGKLRPEYDR